MRAIAKIDDAQIEQMTLDITFRMTVGEWRQIMRQAGSEWPSSNMARQVSSVLGHINKSTSVSFCEPKHAADDND